MRRQLTALVVEDSLSDSEMVAKRLRYTEVLSISVDKVEWLKAALTALRNKHYDIVLLDLNLRDSQGIDTAYSVIRAAPNVPVVVMSTQDDMETSCLCIRAGAQSFLVKSTALTSAHIERVVMYALERSRIALQQKQMMLESREVLSEVGSGHGDMHILEPHLRHIEEAVSQVETYLSRNSYTAAEACRAILSQCGFFVACREMRAVIDVARESESMSSKAISIIKCDSDGVSSVSTPAEASQHIADSMLNFDPKVWGRS